MASAAVHHGSKILNFTKILVNFDFFMNEPELLFVYDVSRDAIKGFASQRSSALRNTLSLDLISRGRFCVPSSDKL